MTADQLGYLENPPGTGDLNPGDDDKDNNKQKTPEPGSPQTAAENLDRIPTMSDEEYAALNQKRAEHADQVGRGYTSSSKSGGSSLSDGGGATGFVRKNKGKLAIGSIAAGLIALLLALIGISGFKLDSLMSNIEQKGFLRNQANLSRRSSKWISAYVEARMMDFGDNPDLGKKENKLFRAKRVDFNNPYFDWYRTLRASNFEQKVFEEHGIKFTSFFDANGTPRLGKININVAASEQPIQRELTTAEINGIANGDIKMLDNLQDYFSLEKFDSHKAGRKAIKEVVNANTYWWQVYKRRSLRKSIQNMTGVLDWRFFEKSRDKVSNKKIELRKRFIDKMVPNTNLIGRIVRCFYGLTGDCHASDDIANKDNQFSGKELGQAAEEKQSKADEEKHKRYNGTLAAGEFSDLLKKILNSINIFAKVLNIPSTLDMLSHMHKNLVKLVKLVVIARGAEAAGLFQVMTTSRDQSKSGELSSKEMSALMQNLDTAASSAGWTQVVTRDGAPPGTITKGGACSEKAQAAEEKHYRDTGDTSKAYAPLCADQQISNASHAQEIQDAYKNSIGAIVGPIVSFWDNLNDTPIIGQIIGIVRWFGNLLGDLIGSIVSEVLDILGLKGDVTRAIAWVFAKTADFLGITILKGYESAGTIFNWLLQGGAYSAESATRLAGGALTTGKSLVTTQKNIALYERDQHNQSSLYDRVASLHNPNSIAYKGATALTTVQSNFSSSLYSGLQNLSSDFIHSFGALFGHSALAAVPDGYAASTFAGIKTYDYPQKCYDRNPITETPLDGTNVLQIFAKYGIKVSKDKKLAMEDWSVVSNSDKWYALIYSIIPNDDGTIAEQIYNCNLLDTVTRGSLGYVFGYTKDNADLVGSTSP